MINTVNNQTAITTYPVKSFNKDFIVNNIDRDKETSILNKEIHDNAMFGIGVGFVSSIPFMIDGNGDVLPLVAKKIGIGIGLGLATGLLRGYIKKKMQTETENKEFYNELQGDIMVAGTGSIIGSTFLTCTAGDGAVFKWCKGKNLALKGGVLGGSLGGIFALIAVYKQLTGQYRNKNSIDTQA